MTQFIYEDDAGGAPSGGGFAYENTPMPPNMGPAIPQKPKLPPGAFPGQQAIGEGVANFLTSSVGGLAGKVAGGLMGPGDTAAQAAGLQPLGPSVEQRVANALTYEPRSKGGESVANVLSAPGRWYQNLANWAGNKAEGSSGSPMLGEMARKAIEVAPYGLGRAPAGAGRVPRMAVDPAEAMFDMNQPAPLMQAPDAAIIAKAREAGVKLTPSEGGGGFISRGLESFAGEPALAKKMSKANEPVAEGMVAKDLPGTAGEITPDSIARARQIADGAYARARASGYMVADNTLTNALDKAVDKFRKQAESFPDNPMIQEQLRSAENAIKGLDGPVMDADATVSLIKGLREQASNAWNGSALEKELAPVKRSVADALEAQIERHLVRTKQPPEVITDFRKARTVLAKAYEAQEASKTGTLNPQYYARKFQEPRHGGMTGGALDLGEAAANFPRSLQNPRNVGNPHGPTIADMVGSAAMRTIAPNAGWGWDLVSLGARPAIRGALASDIGQSMIGQPLSSPAAQGLLYGVAPQATAQEEKKKK